MSRTWERHPHRRSTTHGRGRNLQFARRACCDTFGRKPHSKSCRRDPVMCGVKAAFDSMAEATDQAGLLGTRTHLSWRGYLCPWCELYHLTTKPV